MSKLPAMKIDLMSKVLRHVTLENCIGCVGSDYMLVWNKSLSPLAVAYVKVVAYVLVDKWIDTSVCLSVCQTSVWVIMTSFMQPTHDVKCYKRVPVWQLIAVVDSISGRHSFLPRLNRHRESLHSLRRQDDMFTITRLRESKLCFTYLFGERTFHKLIDN